ncbi:hypothetical protein PoB_002835400 [Plakobranchus ocellatus]|uniref:EB domain-containing protein n=1 Tax=Plakobranchus ocellatus TaxID=259542 RepID=A0AAV4A2J0_9GAST|nr:hypothetical protein PoB_002835400 [Plakobranchus ocellatus]
MQNISVSCAQYQLITLLAHPVVNCAGASLSRKMQTYIFLCFVLVQVSLAFVCPPNACDNYTTQKPLNCKGNVITGGFCDCEQFCAKVLYEECNPRSIIGVPNMGQCDKGLKCIAVRIEGAPTRFICDTKDGPPYLVS